MGLVRLAINGVCQTGSGLRYHRIGMAAEGPTWSDIAGWYDELLRAGSGPHETAVECLLRLIPQLEGASVIDLACGQGFASRALAARGAQRVIGIDSSDAMIEIARRTGVPAGTISYQVGDAQRLNSFVDDNFDGATCQLGLMDIPDLDAALSATYRVLKPGGWFVFVIGHPCFLVPDAQNATARDGRPAVSLTGYFEERFWRSTNPHGVRRVGNYHRTLSTYLNALARIGFHLDAVEEPRPSRLLSEQQPLYKEIPMFFAARAIKRRRARTTARGLRNPLL
jgi:SAM-dependent methyltransferase